MDHHPDDIDRLTDENTFRRLVTKQLQQLTEGQQHPEPPEPLPEPRTHPHAPTILIVEDNPAIRHLLALQVQDDFVPGHVYEAGMLEEALTILRMHAVDIMLIDPNLPDSPTGEYTITTLMEAAPLVATSIIAGAPDSMQETTALSQGAKGYYDKYNLLRDWSKLEFTKYLLAQVAPRHGE